MVTGAPTAAEPAAGQDRGGAPTRLLPAAGLLPAEPGTAPPASRRRAPDALLGRVAGAVAMIAVVAFPALEAVRTFTGRDSTNAPTGVLAALASAARSAWKLQQLVGLPTRFGLHEPGPALTYVAAPFVRWLQATPLAGESLAATVVAGACLAGAVGVLWRRLGPAVALWAAICLDLWMAGFGLGAFRDPTPGVVVVVPVAALAVLWCLGATGTRGAWLWSAVVASFVAQTHLPAAPFALGMVAVGGLAGLVSAAGDDRLELPYRWWRSPARSSGWVALILVWLAPVVELLHDGRTNLGETWSYLTSRHAGAGLHAAARSALAAVTVSPLGPGHHGTFQRSSLETVVSVVVIVVGAGLVLAVAGRRRSTLGKAFVGAAVVGVVIGTATMARSPEPLTLDVAAWMAYVPLALALGLGVALLGPIGPEPLEPPGLRALVKKVIKKAKKRSAAHRPPVYDRHDRDRAPKKAGADVKKAAGKAKSGAKGAATGARRGLPALGWAGPPEWLLVPLAVVALAAAGLTIGAGQRLPALREPRPPAVAPAGHSAHHHRPGTAGPG